MPALKPAAPSAATAGDSSSAEKIYVDNSSVAELKVTCDEAVERILTGAPHGFSASHLNGDVRMALGFTAAAVMIGAGVWAWRVEPEWVDNKFGTAVAVVVYLVLTAAQFGMAHVAGDRIFLGTRSRAGGAKQTLEICAPPLPKAQTEKEPGADGQRWTTPPVYHIVVRSGGKEDKKEVGHCGEWFTSTGEFVEANFAASLEAALRDHLK